MKSCSFSSLESATLIKFLFFNPYGNCASAKPFFNCFKLLENESVGDKNPDCVEPADNNTGRNRYDDANDES